MWKSLEIAVAYQCIEISCVEEQNPNAGCAKNQMKLKICLMQALFWTSSLLLGSAFCSGQDQKKPEQTPDQQELAKRCKTKLLKEAPPAEPKDKEWGKDEKYRGAPTVSYTIQADGSVTNVRLKRKSGVRWIDEYALALVKSRKYEAMPGCLGIETAETITIDFQ